MRLRLAKYGRSATKMKKLLPVTLVLIACVVAVSAQTVTVTGKKVTYTRKKPIADHKRTFVINYPKVTAATPALARRIEAALNYEKVLDINLKDEMGEIQWLEEANFEVKFNQDGVLSVDMWMEGSGAYPSGRVVRVVVDSSTGVKLTPAIAFQNQKALLAMLEKDIKAETAAAIKRIKEDKENGDSDPESLFAQSAEFNKPALSDFSVAADGITFYHDYGFPHVVQALQPDGEFKYSWAVLKPYLKPGGLLARLAR